MSDETLELISPAIELRKDLLAMSREYLREGNTWEQELARETIADPKAFIDKLRQAAQGRGLPLGWVPYRTYWLVRDARTIVATSSLRMADTPHILHEAGHIGYGTRPSERCKGYGTIICARTIQEASRLGFRRILITCDSDNAASARIIEHNGGVLENQVVSQLTGKLKNRYWVTPAPPAPLPGF